MNETQSKTLEEHRQSLQMIVTDIERLCGKTTAAGAATIISQSLHRLTKALEKDDGDANEL